MGSTVAPLPAGYQRYGDRTAAVIMAGVRQFPPNRRQEILRAHLDIVDPTLWSRTSRLAAQLESTGMSSDLALEHGLARAMGDGILAEVISIGKKGKLPTSSVGHVARARLAPSSLGAISVTDRAQLVGSSRVGAPGTGVPDTTVSVTGNPPQGYTWNADHWERARPGSTPMPGPHGPVTITTRKGSANGSVQVNPAPAGWLKGKMVQAGPFLFPADASKAQIIIVQPGDGFPIVSSNSLIEVQGVPRTVAGVKIPGGLPQDVQQDIADILSRDCSFSVGNLAAAAVVSVVALPIGVVSFVGSKPCLTSSMVDATEGHRYGALRDFVPQLPDRINQDYVGVDSVYLHKGTNPVYVATHPGSGKDYGVFLSITAPFANVLTPMKTSDGKTILGYQIPWGAPENPPRLMITWRELSPNWQTQLLAAVKKVAATIVDIGGDILKFIGDEACQLLSGPLGTVGAAAGGAALGGPAGAKAGVLGAQIAQGACANPVPPPLFMPGPSSSMLPILLIGGGVAAVVLLGKKKK